MDLPDPRGHLEELVDVPRLEQLGQVAEQGAQVCAEPRLALLDDRRVQGEEDIRGRQRRKGQGRVRAPQRGVEGREFRKAAAHEPRSRRVDRTPPAAPQNVLRVELIVLVALLGRAVHLAREDAAERVRRRRRVRGALEPPAQILDVPPPRLALDFRQVARLAVAADAAEGGRSRGPAEGGVAKRRRVEGPGLRGERVLARAP